MLPSDEKVFYLYEFSKKNHLPIETVFILLTLNWIICL